MPRSKTQALADLIGKGHNPRLKERYDDSAEDQLVIKEIGKEIEMYKEKNPRRYPPKLRTKKVGEPDREREATRKLMRRSTTGSKPFSASELKLGFRKL